MQPRSSSLINVFGFSLLRNGIKYDYSFKESLRSMIPIVESIYLALDTGEDSTLSEIQKIPKIRIVESEWDMSLSKGLVLSVETNKALSALRLAHHEDGDWGIYLQADEVIHQDDYEIIIADIEKAQLEGYDVIAFRYLHFWQTHHHLAIAKNWYPQEIRAIKLNSEVVSYGDAQSFKNHTKVYQSNARIFHYGHVRDQSVYKNKMSDMSKLYDHDSKKSKYYNEKDRDKDYTDCVLYFGTHPIVMKDRIIRMNDIWELPIVDEIYIVDNPKKYSPNLLSSINAKNVNWLKSKSDIPKNKKNKIIKIPNSFIDKIFNKNKIPDKMKSKVALPWDDQFKLILYLSANNIGMKY